MDENNLDKELKEKDKLNIVDDDDDDIEFDDNINIDEITKQLQQHVDLGDMSLQAEVNQDLELPADMQPQDAQKIEDIKPDNHRKQHSFFDDFPKDDCKKYVVYIAPNNIEYVDSMSIDERTQFINDIINDKHSKDIKAKIMKQRQRYIKHLVLVCITVIVGFPLLFIAVNKGLQASIINYQQSQENFQKLYKEKGKISNYQTMNLRD